MKKRLLLVVGLLAVLVLLAVGCSTHTKGMDSLRWLTDAEKDMVIDIALNTPEGVEATEEYGVYTTRFRWAVMYWYKGNAVLWWMDYDSVDTELPEDISGEVDFYIEVIIKFGEPPQEELRVAINPDTGKVVYTTQ